MFIYFIQGASQRPADEQLIEWKIPRAIGGSFTMGQGPSGQPGIFVAPQGTVPPEYNPTKQRWKACTSTPADVHVSIGCWKDRLAQPSDLIKPDCIPGKTVELGDGNQWMVPLVRYKDPGTMEDSTGCLPDDLTKTREGWVAVPQERYHRLWEIAYRWWNEQYQVVVDACDEAKEGSESIIPLGASWADTIELAIVILQANYDINDDEVSLLKLFTVDADQTSPQAVKILNACSSFDAWIEYAQKKTGEAISLVYGT